MKATRTQRLIRIVQLLRGGRRCDAGMLTSALGVSRRTVFRDMQVLRDAGIGCVYDADAESYRIDRAHYPPPLNLSLEECLAWWVLGYGDQAVVQAPEALRRLVASHAAALVGYYETNALWPAARW